MPKNDQYFDPSHFTGEHIEKQKQELINAFKEDPADKYPNAIRPAYPTNNRMFSAAQGLTKREYFAAMAMQGIFASGLAEPTKDIDFKNIAEDAIRSADELLKQLEK